MRNYNQEMEAAYLMSKRQGNMLRDREQERSPHHDRRNRYIEDEFAVQQRSPSQTGYRWQPYTAAAEPREHDQQPNHRGKGPRNYKRTDDRLREVVCDMMCDHPYLDASNIEVEVKDSEVILTGSVNDRFAKRLAEHVAEEIPGVANVENRIRVTRNTKGDTIDSHI